MLLVSLNIVFSNIAWAMDACSLSDEFSTHHASALNIDSADHAANDEHANSHCDSFCMGWSHFNYIDYQNHSTVIHGNYGKVEQADFIYYSFLVKPPTYPPRHTSLYFS